MSNEIPYRKADYIGMCRELLSDVKFLQRGKVGKDLMRLESMEKRLLRQIDVHRTEPMKW